MSASIASIASASWPTRSASFELMPPPASRKRAIDQLTEPERELVFEIVASKYTKLYSDACKERDNEDHGGPEPDVDDITLEACRINPSTLPAAHKQRAIDAFGKQSLVLDSDNFYMDTDRVYPVPGKPGISGIKFVRTDTDKPTKYFVSEERMTAAEDAEDDGEMVTIRIKTGKGGRAMFRVPKSVAKDMVGCD